MNNIFNKKKSGSDDVLNNENENESENEKVEVVFHKPYDMRPYFLVQTINDEQMVGFIEEYDVFSNKFLKVLTPGGTNREENYKYIPFSSVDYITPISREAAISFISSMATQPYSQYGNQPNQLPSFNFELHYELKQKWDSDRKFMIAKLVISLVLLVGAFVLGIKYPTVKEVVFGANIVLMLLLLSVIVDLIRSKFY